MDSKVRVVTPSEQIINLVNKMGLPLSIFRTMVLAEELTQEEVDDLGYMEDKIDIYLEDWNFNEY